ncbi:MAG: hypothetical protein ACYCZW_03810 [Minisyncoccota bacterium]
MNKKILIVLAVFIIILGFVYFLKKDSPTNTPPVITTSTDVVYKNTEYGFTLELPKDWKDYTLVPSTVQFGEAITLRHPLWTEENKYMDIPIVIYPIEQWQTWEKNNFEGYPTAAPIGPTERGRNNKYVFATAPRYNYSFGLGFETVEEIIKNLKVYNI